IKSGGEGGQPARIITITGGTAGSHIGPNGQCLFGGQVTAIDGEATGFCSQDPLLAGQDVWVLVIDRFGGAGTSGVRLCAGERYLGTRVGTFTIGEDERPLYAVRKG